MYGEDHMWTYQGYRIALLYGSLDFFTIHRYSIAFFCAHCDPEGKGGHGGQIYTSTFCHDEAMERAQKFNHYCPTCGRKIDYNHIVKNFKNTLC